MFLSFDMAIVHLDDDKDDSRFDLSQQIVVPLIDEHMSTENAIANNECIVIGHSNCSLVIYHFL